ncbi:alpha/beta fold hydrolase [Kribbella sp. NPDC004536]|uniref:alpha/beta fold hydrolase n=1 Tax=Kribbella sp. NPDC004536 TaxID=3364106 RepID=UPI0036B27EB3
MRRVVTYGSRDVDLMTVAGRQLRYDVRVGDPRRTPLVLCCGIGAGLEVLQPVVDELDGTVIRFDVPGVGGSPTALLPDGIPRLAWIVDRMLAELGHRQVDVLGLSWGGALAQQLAFQHRRLVRRLVLVSTGTGVLMVPGRPSTLFKMVTPRRFGDPSYAAGMAGYLYGGSARRHADAIRTVFGRQAHAGSRRGYLYQLAAGACWTSLPFLPLIRQPTLVLTGDDDPIVPVVNGRILAGLIPNAELHIYPGGHVELVTEAPVLVPVITAFLTRP